MRRPFCRAILFVCCALLFFGAAPPARADRIFLKNGKVYEGKVVGKSDRRYLFAVQAGDESLRLSFFMEEVDHVDMEKDSAQRQIPFLKEVEDVSFDVPGRGKAYEISLYKKEQKSAFDVTDWCTVKEIREVLNEEEFAYYKAFGEITQRYAPKLVIIDTMYADLSLVTKDDFELAKTYMHDLYYELNNLKTPPAFRRSHETYKESVKATSLSFDALEKGNLELAAQQAQASQEYRNEGLKMFRQVVESLSRPAAPNLAPGEEEPAR